MWKCPVCEQENCDNFCAVCGFERSRDYEHYPTLAKVTDCPKAISRRKKEMELQKQPKIAKKPKKEKKADPLKNTDAPGAQMEAWLPKPRKGMLTWAIVCGVLAVTYAILAVTEAREIIAVQAAALVYAVLAGMFLCLAYTPKGGTHMPWKKLRMKKKTLVILCITVGYALMVPAALVSNTTKQCGEAAYWELEDGVLTIRGTGSISIDSTDSAWLQYRDKIQKVIISDGITDTGAFAFFDCENLTEVEIADSVTVIGDETFYGCTGLQMVDIPEGVTSIGQSAFDGCTGLVSVSIPNTVKVIDYSAFARCSGLTDIYLPESVEIIRYGAFFDCGLTSICIDNPACLIHFFSGVEFDSDDKALKIYGKSGSTAEEYAKKYGYEFVVTE